jgi:hypothetical protein
MHRTRNPNLFGPRLGVLLAVALVAVGASPALARVTRTQTHIYQAFTSSGAPAVHVKSKVRGDCNGGSAATDRADAWRCFAGNFVYDPCFSSSAANGVVLCPTGPGSTSAVEIRLTAGLTDGNKGKLSTSGVPWAVETTSGALCGLNTGATTVVDHRRANYFCAHSKDWLWGAPLRKSEPWTIYSAVPTATRLTHKVKLSVAWF